jgi:hypothetical protein
LIEPEDTLHGRIVEGANYHGAQPQRDRLEMEVLRRVPGFKVNVALGPTSVFARRPSIHRRKDDDRRGIFHPALFQRSGGERTPLIAVRYARQRMLRGR